MPRWSVVMLLSLGACSLDTSALSPGSSDATSDAAVDGRAMDADVPDGVAMDSATPDGVRPDASLLDSTAADAPADSGARDTGGADTRPADTSRADTRPACPGGYTLSALGSCYRTVAAPALDWHDAERDCERDGAHLVVVNDAAEDGMIPPRHWLGYTETISSGSFLWVTGAGASSYDGWASGEPVAGGGACAVTRSDGWHDDICTELKSYVCEVDGRSVDPSTYR